MSRSFGSGINEIRDSPRLRQGLIQIIQKGQGPIRSYFKKRLMKSRLANSLTITKTSAPRSSATKGFMYIQALFFYFGWRLATFFFGIMATMIPFICLGINWRSLWAPSTDLFKQYWQLQKSFTGHWTRGVRRYKRKYGILDF